MCRERLLRPCSSSHLFGNRENLMFSIVYVSMALAYAFAAGSVNTKNNLEIIIPIEDGEAVARDLARDMDMDVQQDKQQLAFEQSKLHFSERDTSETYNDAQEQADLDSFLKTVIESDSVRNCKSGPFDCVDFPTHLLDYLRYLGQANVKKLGTFSTKPAYDTTLSSYEGPTKHLSQSPNQLSAYALKFSDPIWRNEWYMQDYRTSNYPVMDHNIVPVFNMGITGKGVTVAVLGDGVKSHPDIAENLANDISYNFCDDEPGSPPNWKYTVSGYTYSTIGTGSAGVIAMKSGNNVCGVGVAPDVRIAGLRINGCNSPRSNLEATALKYKHDVIDIYCNSWTIDGSNRQNLVELESTVEDALKLGTSEGRNMKGAIYVFPSGANRRDKNNCATNGYVNNPYVITIASAASDGDVAHFSERCTAVFATAYSSDGFGTSEKITTINADGGCTPYPSDKPMGPAIASGIFALVLDNKPSLTYRDMMHLIAMTAEVAPLANPTTQPNTWFRNARGFWVSRDFGFGLLNAENMITLAKNWKTVPDKHFCVINKKFDEPIHFDSDNMQTITIDVSECKGSEEQPGTGKRVVYLEHVELAATIDYTLRGAVYMNLTSPAKTNYRILSPRTTDHSREGYKNWNIMSLHNWGENPRGSWTITVMACRIKNSDKPHGYIHEFTLKLHGTAEKPAHYDNGRRYAAFRLPNGKTNRYV